MAKRYNEDAPFSTAIVQEKPTIIVTFASFCRLLLDNCSRGHSVVDFLRLNDYLNLGSMAHQKAKVV